MTAPATAPMFQRVALIGLGLIAGSMALAMRESGLAGRIVGYARSEETRATAREIGLVDEVTDSAADAVAGADLVVLAVPVGAMGPVAAEIAPVVRGGALELAALGCLVEPALGVGGGVVVHQCSFSSCSCRARLDGLIHPCSRRNIVSTLSALPRPNRRDTSTTTSPPTSCSNVFHHAFRGNLTGHVGVGDAYASIPACRASCSARNAWFGSVTTRVTPSSGCRRSSSA